MRAARHQPKEICPARAPQAIGRPRASVFVCALLLGPLFAVVPSATTDAEAAPVTRTRAASLAASLRRQVLQKVEFKDAPLLDVVKWLRIATGKHILVKHAALAKAGIDPGEVRFTATLERVTVVTLLRVWLRPHNLSAIVKGNILYITTKKDSVGKPITRMYGIAHLTYTKTDFIAPRLDLPSNNDTIEDRPTEVPVEDDPLTDADAVAELIKKLVDPKGWEENDDWTISGTKTYILVRAPRHVHRQMLGALGRIASMK